MAIADEHEGSERLLKFMLSFTARAAYESIRVRRSQIMLWVTNRTNESFIDDVGFPECVVVSARSPETRMCVTAYNTAETFTATTWQRSGEGWVDVQTNDGTGRKQFYEAVAVAGLLASCQHDFVLEARRVKRRTLAAAQLDQAQ